MHTRKQRYIIPEMKARPQTVAEKIFYYQTTKKETSC